MSDQRIATCAKCKGIIEPGDGFESEIEGEPIEYYHEGCLPKCSACGGDENLMHCDELDLDMCSACISKKQRASLN